MCLTQAIQNLKCRNEITPHSTFKVLLTILFVNVDFKDVETKDQMVLVSITLGQKHNEMCCIPESHSDGLNGLEYSETHFAHESH